MYYIEKNNKIVLCDEDKTKIENTIKFMPELKGLTILETDRPIEHVNALDCIEGISVLPIEPGFQFADTEEFKAYKNLQERQRIDMLSLTKREVFLALYKSKNITPEQIKMQITDPAALIEFEYANEYFRGNPLINSIGEMLGYSIEDLDYLFENKMFPAVTSNANDSQINTTSSDIKEKSDD